MATSPSPKPLHPIEASHIHARRERVFLVLAGLFIGSMTMLNILGVTRFIDYSDRLPFPFVVAIGVLPYPITFLCTDFISELYGRKRANAVVWVGFGVNLWVVFILWIGGMLGETKVYLPDGSLNPEDYDFSFFKIRAYAISSVFASMAAYLAAQLCDVYLFHFWKKLTKGRHLWLRNNGSTVVSQFVDTFAVITIVYLTVEDGLPVNRDEPVWPQLWVFIGSGYVFKVVSAAVDTIPFYIGVHYLSRYLDINPNAEHEGDELGEETAS